VTSAAPAEAAREAILERVAEPLAARGLTPSNVPPTLDLLLEGMIDSFGVVELIVMLEQRFGIEFDFDELEADDLTKIGPLSEYVERKAGAR
jgi:acyl carrier protein